jgi:hypothetical protein
MADRMADKIPEYKWAEVKSTPKKAKKISIEQQELFRLEAQVLIDWIEKNIKPKVVKDENGNRTNYY